MRSLFLLVSFLSFVFVGCNEYEDVYLVARKDVFHDEPYLKYQNPQSGQSINLKVMDYSCGYKPAGEVQMSTHYYHRYYPQICGQSIRLSEESAHPLDHNIVSTSEWLNRFYVEIYFDKDVFTIFPLPDSTEAEFVSLAIAGQVYENVYRLEPDSSFAPDGIEEIYYHPSMGMVQVKTTDQQIWILVP